MDHFVSKNETFRYQNTCYKGNKREEEAEGDDLEEVCLNNSEVNVAEQNNYTELSKSNFWTFFQTASVLSTAPPVTITPLSPLDNSKKERSGVKKTNTGNLENAECDYDMQCIYSEKAEGATTGSISDTRAQLYADGENDAFTGIHENYSSKRFRCIQCFQTFTVILAVSLGMVILLHMYPNLHIEYPLIFYYVLFTLSSEALLFIWVSVALLSLILCVGEYGSAHANAMCAVSMSVFQGIIYYASLCLGIYLLKLYLSYLLLNVTILTYILCEVMLSFIFAVRTLPLLYGVICFILHKLHMKISGTSEVRFRSLSLPIHYSSASQYAQALNNMTNPLFPSPYSSVNSTNLYQRQADMEQNISMVNMN